MDKDFKQTDIHTPGMTPLSERSPRVRGILEKKPRGLFWGGIAAVIVSLVILLGVVSFLGWI